MKENVLTGGNKPIVCRFKKQYRKILILVYISTTLIFPGSLPGQQIITADLRIQTVAKIIESVQAFDTMIYQNSTTNLYKSTKSPEDGYGYLLDSIFEINNLGYKKEYCRWYYTYNELYQLDSTCRYYYDENDQLQDIMEVSTYYPNGKLKRFVRKQPDFEQFGLPWGEPDTAILELKIEEYYYNTDEELANKYEINNDYSISDTTKTYLFYSADGKHVKDSVSYSNADYYSISQISYMSTGEIEYEIHTGNYSDNNTYSAVKYTYEYTDTSKLTKIHTGFSDELPINPDLLDTLTKWNNIRYYYETFDSKNRRASLMYWHRNSRYEWKEFKAEYRYNENDDILQTTVYRWTGTLDSGWWVENSHIYYTYNEDGDLLVYDHQFYDDRTNDWQIYNYMEYYYTPVSNELGLKDLVKNEIIIYPNPTQSELHVSADLSPGFSYAIYTIDGRLLISGKLSNKCSIQVSSLEAGSYLLSIYTAERTHTIRFSKTD